MDRVIAWVLKRTEGWWLRNFIFKWGNDWSMNLASMVAYNLITAIFPIILAILSVIGIVLHAVAPQNLDALADAINRAFPPNTGINVAPLLKSLVTLTGPIAIAALIGLLWLGSNLFVNIENAFSIIFRIRGRDLIPQRLVALGMVLILIVLLPTSLGAASFVTAGSDAFRAVLPRSAGIILSYVGPLTSLGVLWVLFLCIYMIVPHIRVAFRYAWRGALVAAVLFGIFNVLFPVYFKVFLRGNTRYGAAAAGILVVIIWLWFFALIMIIGAQINALAMGLKPTPYDLSRSFENTYRAFAPEPEAQAAATSTVTRQEKRLLRLRQRGSPHVRRVSRPRASDAGKKRVG